MTDRVNVFALDRGIWDHGIFAKEPFTEREAWAWLISEAAWKKRRVRIAGKMVEVKRGQVAHSLRFMADKWQWKEPRVRRFLNRLKIDAMIDASSDAGQTIITICNYNKFQVVGSPKDAENDAPIDAGATQERRKEETRETRIYTSPNGEDASASPPVQQPIYNDSRHELWGEGVPILISLGLKDREARSNIGRWLKDTKDDAQAVLGAIQRARDNRVIDAIPWITRSIATGWKQPERKKGLVEAADDLISKINELNTPRYGGNADTPPFRLLSQG